MQPIGLMRPQEVVAELGARLQEQRLKQNLTQAELAQRLGVSVPTISNLENGKNTSLETFIKLVFALGLEQELQGLFKRQSLTIAELENLYAKPKRQRASSAPKEPNAITSKGPNSAVKKPSHPRQKLWDRSLLNSNQEVDD